MPANIKVGGIWKEFDPRVKVSGVWKEVDSGYVKVAGVWKEFYASAFTGIVNWLVGADGGNLFASQDGISFGKINTPCN